MTQLSMFWDGTTTGDATSAPYDSANEFAKVMRSISGAGGIATNQGGVFRGELNELAVTGAATPVSVNTGRGISGGTWYENDAATTIAVPTPAASTRVDVIVMRKDWTAQTVRLVRVAGTEGAGVPAITQVFGTTWDTPLANVSITTGGVITITDRRQFIGNNLFVNVRSMSIGAVLYADSTTTYAMSNAGVANAVLTSNGTVAAWSATPTITTITTTGIGTFGAQVTSAQGLVSTGVNSGTTVASSAILDFSGGNARLISRGANAATNGGFALISTRSDGTNVLTPFAVTPAGLVGVNQSTNSFMTQGITIQQSGNDNEILTLKSTDVAHGMTSQTETDSYGVFKKLTNDGALNIVGLGSSGAFGVSIYGMANAGNTTKTTSAQAAVVLAAGKKSGTTIGAMGATDNLMTISDLVNGARFIFQSDGTSYEDVGTAWTNFDDHDDIVLLTDLSIAVSKPDDPIHRQFASWLRYSPAVLQAMDLVHFNDDGHHFINRSKTQMALIGAARQNSNRIRAVEEQIDELRRELVALKGS